MELERKVDFHPELLVDYRLNVLANDVPTMAEELKRVYTGTNFRNEPGQLTKVSYCYSIC